MPERSSTDQEDSLNKKDPALERQARSVAVVEDDPSMQRSVQRLLSANGIAAEAFSSAEAFLAASASDRVACVVLDIDLPGMSGLELRNRLRAAGSTLPIIFITALDDEVLEDAATRAGCVAFLRKPFSPERLIAAVTSALSD